MIFHPVYPTVFTVTNLFSPLKVSILVPSSYVDPILLFSFIKFEYINCCLG
ncbi:hypothetical protein D3C81_901010 [compost metagenome]